MPTTEMYALSRGRVAVDKNLSVRFLQAWSEGNYMPVEISGDYLALKTRKQAN